MALIQRHFPPSTGRAIFGPEQVLVPLPSTLRNQFPREPRTCSSPGQPFQTSGPLVSLRPPSAALRPSDQSTPSTQPDAASLMALGIPKPPGEVSRGAKRGYNLQEALEWDASLYAEVRVSGSASVLHYLRHRLRSIFRASLKHS